MGILRRKPPFDVLVSRFGKMAGDFIIDLAIHLSRTNQGPKPQQERPEACHDRNSNIPMLPQNTPDSAVTPSLEQ